MSDYYFIKNNGSPLGYDPVLLEDWAKVTRRIARREGVNITQSMILSELGVGKKKTVRRKRIHLYVDGTNLFAGQNELFGPKEYVPFSLLLGDIRKVYAVDHVFFYASYMVAANFNKPGRKALAAVEAQFYRSVKETAKVTFYRGHRSPTSGKEKGVDVHLAVDMVRDAFLRRYDEAVIMTGDADLMYPLEIVQSMGKPVHAVFLPNRFSLEIAYKARSATVLNYRKRFKGVDRKLPEHLRVVNIKKAPHASMRGR